MIQLSSIIRQAGLILLVSLNLSAFSQSYQVNSLSGAAYLPLNYTYPTVHSVGICYDEAISDPITENIFVGFMFNYAGSDYASVRVSSNGFISFVWDGQNLDGKYNNIPTLEVVPEFLTFRGEPILAPFMGDLAGDEQSKALYTRDASRFIFEWQNWKWNNTRISFEVILYSGTNIIEFRYKDGTTLPNNIKIGLLLPNSGFFGPNNPTAVAGQAYQFTPNVIAGNKIQGLRFSIFYTKTNEQFPWEYANVTKGYPGESGNNMDSVNPPGNGSTDCYEHNHLGYGFNIGPDNRVIPCNFNGYGYPSLISIFCGSRAFDGELTIERTRLGEEIDMGWRFPNDLFYSMFSRSNVMGYRAQMRGGIIEDYVSFGKLSYKREIFKRYDFNNIAVDDQNYKWFCGPSGLIKYKDNYWSTFNLTGDYISIEKDGTKWIGNNTFVEYSSPILYKSLNDEDFDLGHIATSGLSVTYTSSNTSVATIFDGKVHIVGIGATIIETNQSGNAEYKPLPTFTQTLIVKETNTITFDSINVKTYGDADFSPIATSTSGLPVSYKCYDTTVATIVNGKIHITGSGTCNIYANQKGDNIYGPAKTTSRVLKVNESNQKIIFIDFPSNITYDYGDFNPGATASSGLPVTYSSSNANVATIVNGNIHITGVGTCKIYANQEGGGIYRPAITVSRDLIVNKAAQTITFHSLIKRYGDVDFDPGATASSGLPVTYSSPEAIPNNTYTFATMVDGKIHLLDIGTVKLYAYQEGNANYLPAEPKITFITIDKFVPDFNSFSFEPYPNIQYQPLITIPLNCKIPPSSVLYKNPSIRYILQFERSDGNALEYNAPYSDTSITFPGAVGVCKMLVKIVFEDSRCQSSTFNLSTFNISKANQTISFDAITAKTYGDTDFALGATSNTNLAVNYSSSNLNVATVENGIVHIVGAGICSILANQPGNENYYPAAMVSQTLTVGKAAQTITFSPLPSKTYGDADFGLEATASSDLGVTYTSSNTAVAQVVGGIIHIVGAGESIITAKQDGSNSYNAAPEVSQTLTVGKAAQTITFSPLPSKTYGDADFGLEATASSDLGVTYTSSNTAVAQVVGGIIHIVGAGESIITAKQDGSNSYNAAPEVSQTLTVGKAAQTITFSPLPSKTYGDADFGLEATASSDLGVTYTSSNTAVAQVIGGIIHIVGAGESIITAKQEGSNSYNAAPEVSQTLTVGKAAQTITFSPLPSKTYGDADFGLEATASSDLGVTFTSSNTAVAQVIGGIIHIVGAGESIITAKQEGSNSYNAAPEVSQTLTVGKAAQTITFSPLPSKTYGDADFGLEATASSNLGVTYTSSNTTVAQVVGGIIHIVGAGESIITAKQEGSNSYNAAPEVSQTTIILPKPIEVTANTNQKIYGETDPPLTFNVTPNLLIGDAVTGALSRVSGDNVGVYSIQQGTLTLGNNYRITFNGADFKVVNRSLTINAQDKTRDYGVNNPPYTLLFSGFANGDCETVLDQLPTISCSALQYSNSGSYPIVVVGGFDNNYCFTLRNGTLWVNTILGSVATTAAQNVTTTNVDLTGEVLNHGGDENASRGFVYGTTPNPTIMNSKVEVGSGIGSFTEVVRNLISNTNYYVRSYVTNSAGTAYGNQLLFTTLTVGVSVTNGCALTIYPNPTSGIVYFENIKVNMKVEIFRVDGEFVKRAEISEENNKIDLTDCKAGIYMIRFIFDNRINTIRVVKI